jgi:DNA-binding LacI/PurR family transcriptional regulator
MTTVSRTLQHCRISLKDVAKEAGCSVAVVSTVLNDTKGCSVVSEKLRQRVTEVARRLDYRPNFASQSLVRGRTNTIGVYNPPGHNMGLGNSYGGRLLAGMEEACRQRGYDLLLVNMAGQDSSKACLQKLAEHRVDGMIILRWFLCENLLESLPKYASRVVLVDAEAEQKPYHSVVFDNAGAIECAVEHLVQQGHRRIGFLGSCLAQPQQPWVLREEGYLRAMRRLGIPIDERLLHNRSITPLNMTLDDEYCQAEGELGMRYLLSLGSDRPTAVISYNDLVAVNACRICIESGVAIPSEMSMVGMGDSERCQYVRPMLTSLHHPLEEMGQCAAEYLIDVVETGQSVSTSSHVEPFAAHIVSRESVKPFI